MSRREKYEATVVAALRELMAAHKAGYRDRDYERAEGLLQATQMELNAALHELKKLK